jgi:PEP-CTERM motif
MRAVTVASLFFGTLAAASAGAIVFQDNFSSGAPGVLMGDSTAGPFFTGANFSLTAGSIDLTGPGFYSELCQGTATYCIDTTGAGASRGQIAGDAFSLDPGTYLLSFDLFGWNSFGLTETASVNVQLGALVNQTYNTDGAVPFSGPTLIAFTVGSSLPAVQLVFTDTGTNDSSAFAGAILDNIVVQAVPEPASMLLAGGALVGLGLLRLRKK